MLFGTHKRLEFIKDFNLIVNGTHIERVESLNYLGIMIDSHLSFAQLIFCQKGLGESGYWGGQGVSSLRECACPSTRLWFFN